MSNLTSGGPGVYSAQKQTEIIEKAKAAFEKKITKNAGRTGMKAAISEKMADMGYDFTRYMTKKKNYPTAAEIRKKVSEGRYS